jgi:hypothetical protein
MLKSADVKLKSVGEGKELNIWYQTADDSLKVSMCSDDVRAQNELEL